MNNTLMIKKTIILARTTALARTAALVLPLAFSVQSSFAKDDMNDAVNSHNKQVEVISIFGSHNQLETATGSAVVIGEAELDLFEFDDAGTLTQMLIKAL